MSEDIYLAYAIILYPWDSISFSRSFTTVNRSSRGRSLVVELSNVDETFLFVSIKCMRFTKDVAILSFYRPFMIASGGTLLKAPSMSRNAISVNSCWSTDCLIETIEWSAVSVNFHFRYACWESDSKPELIVPFMYTSRSRSKVFDGLVL